MEPTRCILPILSDGLGNRLFQLAMANGLAIKWNVPLYIALDSIEKNPHGDADTLLRLFPMIPILSKLPTQRQLIHERTGTHYETFPFGNTYPGSLPVVLKGYWQSSHYSKNAPLKPDWNAALGEDVCSKIRRDAKLDTPEDRMRTWLLHVRIGDYAILPHHQINTWGYISRALLRLPKGARIHVFTDTIQVANEGIRRLTDGMGFELTWSTTTRDVEALYEMSLCQGGAIVANSTFSYWGATFARQSCSTPETFRAIFPSSMGQGLPPPTDYAPSWATIISTN